MMKCLVGIDTEGRYEEVLDLLGKLKFEIEETTLLHANEPLQVSYPYSAYGMFCETDELAAILQKVGNDALFSATEFAEKLNLHPKPVSIEGFPINSLNEMAANRSIDLIAVTSSVRSSVGAFFGGSVARGLVINSKQSLLVARQGFNTDHPLKVVFATDQSPYCGECMKALIKMVPKGITEMTVLTVYERSKHESVLALMRGGNKQETLDQTAAKLTAKAEELAKWLTENGIPSISKLVSGNVEETIHNFMHQSKADLLIVGSQGHGFLDRLVIGSTSLHQVTGEQYPVLVLRTHL